MTTKRFQTGTKRFLGPPKGFLGHQRFQALADRFRNTGEQVTKGAKHRTTRFLLRLNVLKPGDVECETRTPLPKPVVLFLFCLFLQCSCFHFVWFCFGPNMPQTAHGPRTTSEPQIRTTDTRPTEGNGNQNTKMETKTQNPGVRTSGGSHG